MSDMSIIIKEFTSQVRRAKRAKFEERGAQQAIKTKGERNERYTLQAKATSKALRTANFSDVCFCVVWRLYLPSLWV